MLNWRDPKNPQAGGAERVSLAYLSTLVQRGHEVFWFANDFPGALKEEKLGGISYVRSGGRGTSVWKAIRWYRQQKPFDLVIDQHHGIPWYAPWWCNTNCIAYIHEVLGPIWSVFYSPPLSMVGRWQESWTHRLYRKIPFWVPSESTRTCLLARGVQEVHVFPNGVDTLPVTELADKPLSRPLRLVVVSRLAPNKRIDHALRVVQLLNARQLETKLTVVGGGECEAQLKLLASRLGISDHVIFTGSLKEGEKNAQLKQAHFLIHTSVREGWGLNVLEANALGTPAVVYPVGGLVDSTVHGETGIVSATETPESLADCLTEIARLPDTYVRYRTNAWERSKTFQWDQVLPKACDWLETIARLRPAPHRSRTR